MQQGRAARRLGALAARLRPEQPPFYVRLPVPPGLERTFPAPGWYWRPQAHPAAIYLGHSFETAALTLHQLLAEQEHQAA